MKCFCLPSLSPFCQSLGKRPQNPLILFHLRGLPHCSFKSTGSIHLSAGLLPFLHAITWLVLKNSSKEGWTHQRSSSLSASRRRHQPCLHAWCLLIHHQSGVWAYAAPHSPGCWQCVYLLLPVSYCKAWREQQSSSRFCMWIGGGQRGQGMQKGRRRGQCLWMRVAMVTKFQQVLVYLCCANDTQSVSKSLIPHEFITVAATKICFTLEKIVTLQMFSVFPFLVTY